MRRTSRSVMTDVPGHRAGHGFNPLVCTLLAAMFALALPACFGDDDEVFVPPDQTTTYDLEPGELTILEGSTTTLQVTRTYCEKDNQTGQRTCDTSNATSCCERWLSSNPAVADVTPGTGGRATVTTLAEGDAEILAHVFLTNGVPTTTARALVHVWPASMQLVVSAPSLPVLAGSTAPLVAELRRTDGTAFAGGSFAWQTSDPNVATVQVDAADSHRATLSAIASGTVTITASEQTLSLVGTAPVSVTSLSVTISPRSPTVILGGTRDLTATAQRADGTVAPVPFTWSSSDPGIVSVTVDPNSSDRATVTGSALGTAVIRARETTEGARDSIFVTVAPLVTNTFIEGTARAPADGTPLPALVILIGHTVTGAAYRSTTDAQGRYRVGVSTGGAYNIYFQGVANFSFNQTEGDVIQVIQGQTTTFDPDLTKGYHLSITGGRGDLTAAPGASLQLFLNYTAWARSGAALATVHIVAGVDGTAGSAYSAGTPGAYPGSNGTASLTITAPVVTGDYGIHVLLANTRTAPEAITAYNGRFPDPYSFIRIGTLMVR